MKYILDFDRTLFDTDRFVQAAEPYKAAGEWLTPRIWDTLDARSFLYDDVLPFLEAVPADDVVLLTAWTSSLGPESYAFQETKVQRSGVVPHVHRVVLMEGDKGPYVKRLTEDTPAVFVDDRIEHLLSARARCSDIHVLQMTRPGVGTLPSDTSVTVIRALADIQKVVSV